MVSKRQLALGFSGVLAVIPLSAVVPAKPEGFCGTVLLSLLRSRLSPERRLRGRDKNRTFCNAPPSPSSSRTT